MSVHNTHCCNLHGCKYGDEDCPVVLGNEMGISEEWCELCQDDKHDPEVQERKRLKEENAKMREVLEWIATADAVNSEYQYEARRILYSFTIDVLKKEHSHG